MYNKICRDEKIAEEWEVGQILPIHKKGNIRNCTNYREITTKDLRTINRKKIKNNH